MLQMIVGLGNPGASYAGNRHNAGFWLVDELAARLGVRFATHGNALVASGNEVRLMKPTSYMNLSGLPTRRVCDYFKIPSEAIIVAHDDLDLPPGSIRLKQKGGHGGHNGLRDLITHLGADFARIRIGIGHPGSRERVHGYVLSNPSIADKQSICDALNRALDLFEDWSTEGFSRAQQQLNTR